MKNLKMDTVGEKTLTKEDRQKLFEEYVADIKFTKKGATCNSSKVWKLAKTSFDKAMKTGRITLDDLMQECYIGAWLAAQKYNPNCNASYSTFATLVISQRLTKFVAENNGLFKINDKQSAVRTAIIRKYQALMADDDKDPNLDVIEEILNTVPHANLPEIYAALNTMTPEFRLDACYSVDSDESDMQLSEIIFAPTSEADKENDYYSDTITDVLLEAKVTPREIEIFKYITSIGEYRDTAGEHHSIAETAARYGVTKYRVKAIRDACMTIIANNEDFRESYCH